MGFGRSGFCRCGFCPNGFCHCEQYRRCNVVTWLAQVWGHLHALNIYHWMHWREIEWQKQVGNRVLNCDAHKTRRVRRSAAEKAVYNVAFKVVSFSLLCVCCVWWRLIKSRLIAHYDHCCNYSPDNWELDSAQGEIETGTAVKLFNER